jgi:antitoxin component YwqK of YwqJK toxin-antitoxin module
MNQKNDKGLAHGYWEHYYDHRNGELSGRGTYVNGKRHGYWEDYYHDGILNWKGHFNNEERTGYWEWHPPIINQYNRIEKEFYL